MENNRQLICVDGDRDYCPACKMKLEVVEIWIVKSLKENAS